jgi:predicted small secreted protein
VQYYKKDKNISNTKKIKIAEECEKYTKKQKEYYIKIVQKLYNK